MPARTAPRVPIPRRRVSPARPPPALQLWLAVWATAASMGFVAWGLDLVHAWGKRCLEAAAADPAAPRPPLLTPGFWGKQRPVLDDYVYRSLLRFMRVRGHAPGSRGQLDLRPRALQDSWGGAGARVQCLRASPRPCRSPGVSLSLEPLLALRPSPPLPHPPSPQSSIWLTKNNAAKLAVVAYAFVMLTLALLYSANTSAPRAAGAARPPARTHIDQQLVLHAAPCAALCAARMPCAHACLPSPGTAPRLPSDHPRAPPACPPACLAAAAAVLTYRLSPSVTSVVGLRTAGSWEVRQRAAPPP